MNPPPQQKNLHVLLFKLVFETSPSFKMATFVSWMTGTPKSLSHVKNRVEITELPS